MVRKQTKKRSKKQKCLSAFIVICTIPHLCDVDGFSELNHQASTEAVAPEIRQADRDDGHLHVVLLLCAQRDRRHASLYNK